MRWNCPIKVLIIFSIMGQNCEKWVSKMFQYILSVIRFLKVLSESVPQVDLLINNVIRIKKPEI